MEGHFIVTAIIFSCFANRVSSQCNGDNEVRARTHTGCVCGTVRSADHDAVYVSFRGIPYAEQPTGKYRFTELRSKIPWDGYYDAKSDGPVCPQYDDLYGRLVYPHRLMREECIHVNVHVPLGTRYYEPGFRIDTTTKLPIVVYIHGGAFHAGSGDADLNGPEYIVSKGVILITFNYRLNVFGFLSLNSSEIPGNNGIRDGLTLLRWVQTNAVAFGGNPDNVTLMGQSSGAAIAHILSFSDLAKGLFKRIIMTSGIPINFFSSSPIYSKYVANLFLTALGINSTDSAEIHQQLIDLPLSEIMRANKIVQLKSGFVPFSAVVETQFPGIKRMLEDDPISLIKSGRGKEFPLITGFNSVECQAFKNLLVAIDIMKQIEDDPRVILAPRQGFDLPSNLSLYLAEEVKERYFNGRPTLDKYIESCTDTFFKYPAFALARLRAAMCDGAPMYLYYFKYEGDFSAVKEGLDLEYTGAAHFEELTYIFRVNSLLGNENDTTQSSNDYSIKEWMTTVVVNFAQCGKPSCTDGSSTWSPVQGKDLHYQLIEDPNVHKDVPLSNAQSDMIKFFDTLEEKIRCETNGSYSDLLEKRCRKCS